MAHDMQTPGTTAANTLCTAEHFIGIMLSSILLGLVVTKGKAATHSIPPAYPQLCIDVGSALADLCHGFCCQMPLQPQPALRRLHGVQPACPPQRSSSAKSASSQSAMGCRTYLCVWETHVATSFSILRCEHMCKISTTAL